jgi:hypothetical protein
MRKLPPDTIKNRERSKVQKRRKNDKNKEKNNEKF